MEGGDSASQPAKVKLQLNSGLVGVIAVTFLLLASFYLWTLPFQNNRLPFGEGDSAWHFAIGDNIASNDKATFDLPYYIALWYAGFNTLLGKFAPEYPPPNHVNYALMQVFGGERFTPVFIYRAFASFLGVLSVFFLVSRLFGVLPGFLAGLGLSFSMRERLMYLFGQQPTVISIAIAPAAIYAWYKYVTSFYEEENGAKKAYLFVTVGLLASQYLLHFQGFLCSVIVLAIFTAAMAAKFRKLPVSKSNAKSLGVAALAFIILAAPFLLIYLGTGGSELKPAFHPGKLGGWGPSPDEVRGNFPPASVAFSAEYPGIIPVFLFAGIALLLLRIFLVKSNTKEILLLSWLVGVYLILHLDAFTATSTARITRMLVLENYLFYSLIALSVVWLPSTIASLVKLNRNSASIAKYSLAIILAAILVFGPGVQAKKDLKSAYSGLERITPLQADFAQNVLGQLPEKAFVYDQVLSSQAGQQYRVFRYPKIRWMLAISQRYVGRNSPINNSLVDNIDETYYLFDYSDLALFASSADPNTNQFGLVLANELRGIEVKIFNSTIPVFDQNNIRLYKYYPGLEVVS